MVGRPGCDASNLRREFPRRPRRQRAFGPRGTRAGEHSPAVWDQLLMRFCWFSILIAGACAAGLAGCRSPTPGGRTARSSAPMLTAAAADRAGLSTQEAGDADRLYTAKCMRCHKSYVPDA